MKPVAKQLTKSRIQYGRQCHKRLWLEVHHPELAQPSDAVQGRLEAGTQFGEFVRKWFDGVLVDAAPYQKEKALAQTRIFLDAPATRVPMLYEAAFEHEGVFVRVDALLRYRAADRLIEVKSSAKIKDEYFWDCAIQTWVARGAGRRVKQVSLCLVDNSFVYTREGDYKGLLNLEDCTEQVEDLLPQVPSLVPELKAVMAGKQPRIATGPHCQKPYPCPFFEHCRAAEPPAPTYPVEDLGAPAAIRRLLEAGLQDLCEVPDEMLEREKHKRIVAAAKSGEAVTSPEFESVLASIPYPRCYLDFETIGYIVPRWLGTKPFQQVPFQFSCHIERKNRTLEHREHLDLSGALPVEAFADALLAAVGKTGPILVWNQSFEATRVRELAEMLSAHILSPFERLVRRIPYQR